MAKLESQAHTWTIGPAWTASPSLELGHGKGLDRPYASGLTVCDGGETGLIKKLVLMKRWMKGFWKKYKK